jgi:hypothetical protein
LFRLNQWIVDPTPFGHLPKLPGSAFTVTPVLWLTVVALALGAAGSQGCAEETSRWPEHDRIEGRAEPDRAALDPSGHHRSRWRGRTGRRLPAVIGKHTAPCV